MGQQLEFSRSLSDYPAMYADMIAVLVIGITIDIFVFVFGKIEHALRRRYGLVETASE